MALCLVLLCSNYSNSQTVDPVTGATVNTTDNILNLGGGLPWSNTVSGAAGGYSGGSTPAYNSSTGNIIFGYVQGTVSQRVAINTALANAGTGIQLSGYYYSWNINNDLSNSGGNRGSLTGNVSLTGPTGNVLESFNYNYSQTNTGSNFQTFKGNQFFNNRYDTTTASNLVVSFTGKDQNWWAGYYGPRVHVNDVSLLYTTNPCATNPAYSSTCAGFSSVVTSPNQVNSNLWGTTLSQAVAINTALTNAGIGATVHGFKYSFDYNVGQSWSGCTATNQDGSCSWYMDIPSSVKLTASMTNSSNQPLYQKSYSLTGDGTGGTISGQYLLSSSLNQTALGSIRMSGSSMGEGSSIGNFNASIIYTPDPCASNPLYSASCKGYGAAFAKNMLLGSTVASATGVSNPQPDLAAAVASSPPDSASPSSQPANQSTQPSQQQTQAGPASSDNSQPQQQQQAPAQAPASNAPVASAAPSATNPQPKPGDVQVAGSNKSNGGGSSGGGSGPSSLAMSVVASVQSRVGATEKATVQQANDAAATATSQATQTAESVAGSAQATSIVSSMTTSTSSSSSKSTNNQNGSGTFSLQTNTQINVASVSALKPYSPIFDTTTDTSTSVSVVPGLDIVKMGPNTTIQVAMVQPQTTSQPLQAPQQVQQQSVQVYQSPIQLVQPTVNYSLTAPSTITFEPFKKQETFTITEVEIVKTEGIKMGTKNTLTDYMNEATFMSLMGAEQTQDGMVKRNVQPNEVAGGVDIASIATQPKGYDAYAQMTLKDASFYKVEDIYKNQKTVDNVRLLRGLTGGSDRLHQEMVNQQYKGK